MAFPRQLSLGAGSFGRVGRSPLLFPGGTPGIDYTHPAARGSYMAGVAQDVNFINLARGNASTVVGAGLAAGIDDLGPYVLFNGTAGQGLEFPVPQEGFEASTYAVIVMFADVSGLYTHLIGNRTSGLGTELVLYNGTIQAEGSVSATVNSGFTPVANVPYFIAATSDYNTYTHFAITNLRTGEIYTATGTGTQGHATTTSGNIGVYAWTPRARFYAGLFSWKTALSAGQLYAWARDPWSFWYPNANSDFLFVPPPRASAVVGSNIPAFQRHYHHQRQW